MFTELNEAREARALCMQNAKFWRNLKETSLIEVGFARMWHRKVMKLKKIQGS